MKEVSITVPYIDQTQDWPTGCESVSAVMLLQYLGIPISVAEFVEYLPKYELKQYGEILVGADPNRHFIGSPSDPDSFGCYAPVICETLNQIFTEKSLPFRAENVSGQSTKELLEQYIDRQMPVIYWATIDLKESTVGPSWTLYVPDGEIFTWRSNEHCMLLTGYTDHTLYFNDPWHNHGCIAYDRTLAIARHKEMYAMAVAVQHDTKN